jgi:hypothetical protein
MTKKDYKIIADVLYDTDNECTGESVSFNRTLLIENLCIAFKKDNERFNEQMFKEACYGK